MENNEIMEVCEFGNLEIVDLDSKPGMSTGKAVAIGVGATLVVGAGVKLAKWIAAKIKAKKELRLAEDEILVDDNDIERVVTK